MIREYTVKQYAMREQVTRGTVRVWIQKGALEIRRTPGGHYRIIERAARVSSGAAVITLDPAPKH